MNIRKNGVNGKISIDSVDYVPVYCYDRGNGNGKNRYELLDIRAEIADYEAGNTEKINANLYKILKSELKNIETVIGEPINKSEKEIPEAK
ncbi:MAG: hypothetical protein HFJ50_10185 [Clostridia bacterium]|jgi:hypothetical protein|nr:hypothetical protein [Clostridia bacterium]